MKSFKVVIALLLIALAANAANAEEMIRNGTEFPSPDGKFIAQIDQPAGWVVNIKNKQSGVVEPVEVGTLIYSLKWTGDSQTIVMVVHVSGGSETWLIHHEQNQWRLGEVGDPDGAERGAIIKQEIGWNSVRLTIKGTNLDSRGKITEFHVTTFYVNTDSGAVSNISKRVIDKNAYMALKPDTADNGSKK